jgi:caffeoyl-CoA O-methyltransferase
MSDTRNAVIEYICDRFAREDDLLKQILQDQLAGGGPMMNIGPDQGKLLDLLVRLHKPRLVLELGSYFGYSSIWIARALKDLSAIKPGHQLYCVEISEKQCSIIKNYLSQAGLSDLVTVTQGAGLDLMNKFIRDGMSFDMIFIDADKANYPHYLDLAYALLPSGGLLLVDNCIWNGQVADLNFNDTQTQSIRAFNDKLAAHEGFNSVIITIQDGLALGIKK